MRTTVLPSMLQSLAHNHAHRNATASLYEMGTVYLPSVKDGKATRTCCRMTQGADARLLRRLSFFQFKGVIEALCAS